VAFPVLVASYREVAYPYREGPFQVGIHGQEVAYLAVLVGSQEVAYLEAYHGQEEEGNQEEAYHDQVAYPYLEEAFYPYQEAYHKA